MIDLKLFSLLLVLMSLFPPLVSSAESTSRDQRWNKPDTVSCTAFALCCVLLLLAQDNFMLDRAMAQHVQV